MAKIEFPGFDVYVKQLRQLGADIDGIIKYASYDAAGMVADAIKANTPVDSGDLRNSLALTPYRNDSGFINTKIMFDGYDHRGVPNAIKARVLESGNSTHKKQPFVRPAVNRVRSSAIKSMEAQLDKKINELMKGS